jgi:hypothetical protein
MCAVVKCVKREVLVQYEIQGQNMCIDEMIVFLVFLFCVVVKYSSLWRNVLPPSSGWLDCLKWMLKWCGGGRYVGDIWYWKYKVNVLLTVHRDISYNKNQLVALFAFNLFQYLTPTCFEQTYCSSSGGTTLYMEQLLYFMYLCWLAVGRFCPDPANSQST